MLIYLDKMISKSECHRNSTNKDKIRKHLKIEKHIINKAGSQGLTLGATPVVIFKSVKVSPP